ncbi:branched-chain amino acid ABC transporter permease [Pusillimonas sp. TS35]|uniref:branched-chain amino acid ABC transporter permease n=1 Tax=Paracandidimonas lactea TaxID=2895524 RepID=UPI00136CC831|nr:branched-chain amino acid ABC transporter permease [Paracandidimonas lactea]MYN13923.1 branched-chain amino acid ABC transporter permease [Pusillimonas sp. TS35]
MTCSWLDWKRADAIAAAGLAGAVIAVPLFLDDKFFLNLVFLVFLYAGLASAWNLLGGLAGQFSLGHTAFFGIGAYASTLLYTMAGVSPWFGMCLGVLLSLLLAFLISYPVFRLRGVFFAMATIAMGETVRITLLWARARLDLPYGLSVNFEPAFANMIFADTRGYAWLGGAFMLLSSAICYMLMRTRTGFYLRALRDNEEAAQSVGIDLRRYKLIAFLLSAGLTSIGGTLMAQYVLYIEPATVFSLTISIDVALMSILGGIGTIFGPLIGAVVTLPLQEFLKDWLGPYGAGAHLVVYALILIVIVMVLPEGVMGVWRKLRRFSVGGRRHA